MKNKVKKTALILALIVSMASIVGCSNNSSTSTEASVSSNSSIESSVESSIIEESSILESSAEISSETTSATESSVSSNSSAIDPDVEERSYSDEEKYKPQPTKFSDYSYYPAVNGYEYSGNASKVTIPSEFTKCPGFYYDCLLYTSPSPRDA